MNSNEALWEKGDFTRIAESMRESGEELVQKIGVAKGMKVLDLGCGAMARRPCRKPGWARMCSASISPPISSRPGTSAPRPRAFRTAGFRKATPLTCAISRTAHSISS